MIVSHEHEFIFLKTRKTAGTSVEIALSEYCGPDDIITPILREDEKLRRERGFRGPQNYVHPSADPSMHDRTVRFLNHSAASYVRRHIGEEIWKRYFKFSIERDPFDKAISRYYWSAPKSQRPSIAEYLESASVELLSNWTIYTIDDEIAVDLMVRYEHLLPDLALATQRIGLPGELRLPNAKGGHRIDRRPYNQVLDAASRKLIERVCANECAEFSYRWSDEQSAPATSGATAGSATSPDP